MINEELKIYSSETFCIYVSVAENVKFNYFSSYIFFFS